MTHSCCLVHTKVEAEHGVGGQMHSRSLFDHRATGEMYSCLLQGGFMECVSCAAVLFNVFQEGVTGTGLESAAAHFNFGGRKSGWVKVTAERVKQPG